MIFISVRSTIEQQKSHSKPNPTLPRCRSALVSPILTVQPRLPTGGLNAGSRLTRAEDNDKYAEQRGRLAGTDETREEQRAGGGAAREEREKEQWKYALG